MSARKKILLVIGILFFLLLAIDSILSMMKEKNTPLEIPPAPSIQPIYQTEQFLLNSTYSGLQPEIPEKLAVYQSMRQTQSITSSAEQIALEKNLIKHPTVTNAWENQESGEELRVLHNQSAIQYIHQNLPKTTKGFGSVDEIVATAENFTQNLHISPKPVFNENNIEFFEGTIELHKIDANAASIAKISSSITLGEYPLQIDGSTLPTAALFINTRLEVVKAVFSPLQIEFSFYGEFQPIDINSALENIKNGKGIVLSFIPINDNPFPINDLVSATFSTFSIEYRYTSQSKLLYPYFVLTGVGFTQDGKEAEVSITTPAL